MPVPGIVPIHPFRSPSNASLSVYQDLRSQPGLSSASWCWLRQIIHDTCLFLFVSSLIPLTLLAYFLVLALKEEVVRRHWTFRLFQLLPRQLLVAHDDFENACAVSERVVDSTFISPKGLYCVSVEGACCLVRQSRPRGVGPQGSKLCQYVTGTCTRRSLRIYLAT